MRGSPSDAQLCRRFELCTGSNYDLFYKIQEFDRCPGVTPNNTEQKNRS